MSLSEARRCSCPSPGSCRRPSAAARRPAPCPPPRRRGAADGRGPGEDGGLDVELSKIGKTAMSILSRDPSLSRKPSESRGNSCCDFAMNPRGNSLPPYGTTEHMRRMMVEKNGESTPRNIQWMVVKSVRTGLKQWLKSFFVGVCSGIIIPKLLRWRRISSIHSRFKHTQTKKGGRFPAGFYFKPTRAPFFKQNKTHSWHWAFGW